MYSKLPPDVSMSDPSLKCVMQYMEANKRIELAQRCPSLKAVEKSAPLRIETLNIWGNQLKINGTLYQLGVIQEFKNGTRFTHTDKTNGGWPEDLNEYGCEVATTNHILTPGDIQVPPIRHDENVINTKKEDQFLKKLEEQLNSDTYRFKDKTRREYWERELYSRRCQMNQELPPCEMYILLTITKPNGSKSLEAVKYDKKLYQAMKYLNTQIFGGRDSVVDVKKFAPFFPTTDFGSVLRLPDSLKFKVLCLEVKNNVELAMNGFSPLLDPRSFPLDEIKIHVLEGSSSAPQTWRAMFMQPWNHENPVVQSAKSLHIVTKYTQCLQFALEARNPKVRLDDKRVRRENLLDLINKIMKEEWRQNIVYSFGIDEKNHFCCIQEIVEAHDTWIVRDCEKHEKCFIRVHMNSVRDLCINFEPIPGSASYYNSEPRWLLEIYTGERKDPGVVENFYNHFKGSFFNVLACFRNK